MDADEDWVQCVSVWRLRTHEAVRAYQLAVVELGPNATAARADLVGRTMARMASLEQSERLYSIFNLAALFWAPLLLIVASYAAAFVLIQLIIAEPGSGGRRESALLEGSDQTRRRLLRTRRRTLRESAICIALYILTWSPYNVTALWTLLDRETAAAIPVNKLSNLIVANAVLNPARELWARRQRRRRRERVALALLGPPPSPSIAAVADPGPGPGPSPGPSRPILTQL